MISVELATALKQAGLVWHPASGDRFTLTTGAFDDEVFTLSDMVVEAQESRPARCWGSTGRPNGRWTPRRSPTRCGCRGRTSCGDCSGRRSGRWSASNEGYRVTSVLPGDHADGTSGYWGAEPSEAYGRALLALIRRATS